MAPTVRVQDLKKSYGRVEAVRGLSFSAQPGEIFGLLGPNGAGKTTTLECILGLRDPDSGSIEVCGIDLGRNPAAAKERIGAALQSTGLQDKITPREALKLFASFYKKHADLNSLIDRFNLGEKADSFYDTLSGGQKQRLALTLALVNEPDFLLLDEPTAALDPQSRRELHDAIRSLKTSGKTVVLTTHYIEEAEQLCDRIAIVDHGKIIAEGTPTSLIAASKALPTVTVQTARPLDVSRASQLPSVATAAIHDGALSLKTARVGETVIELVKWIEADGNELSDMQVRKPTLEDVFIELTGRRLRD